MVRKQSMSESVLRIFFLMLHAAAFGGYVQVLQRLLQLGAEVDQQDNVGASALFHACMNTHTNDNAVTIAKIL
jgi:ankyrin repeat protein